MDNHKLVMIFFLDFKNMRKMQNYGLSYVKINEIRGKVFKLYVNWLIRLGCCIHIFLNKGALKRVVMINCID